MKPARTCTAEVDGEVCNLRKNASCHYGSMWTHDYEDAARIRFGDVRKPVNPVSEETRRYKRKTDYAGQSKAIMGQECWFCAAGAPNPTVNGVPLCSGKAEGMHHTLERSAAGGLKASEARAPKIPAGNGHNTWASQTVEGRRWSQSHTFWHEGKEHPFLVDGKTVVPEKVVRRPSPRTERPTARTVQSQEAPRPAPSGRSRLLMDG